MLTTIEPTVCPHVSVLTSDEGIKLGNNGKNGVLTKIYKRDGTLADFDQSRVYFALLKAGRSSGEYSDAEATFLTTHVIDTVKKRYVSSYPTVEQIQDIVEYVLVSNKFLNTAHNYIAYRERHRLLRDDTNIVIKVDNAINEYLGRSDWRVNANANQGYSLGGLILNISGKMVANYWLSHVYPSEIGEAHRKGDIHIHDLDMLSGYCAGWSLRTLLTEGFNGVPGKIESVPPKHLSSAIGQMVNFLGTLQNEWAGAQAFSSFDTYLAPFVRIDNLSFHDVKQKIQEFIYNLNVPSRWGTQTPFTNVTFDWVCPRDLFNQKPIIGGIEQSFTYGELGAEMDLINRAYLEVMISGDAKGRVFTFPIPTYNITKDFDWEHPNSELLFEMAAKYGIPYFQNFLNSDLDPSMVRSMCCRLQLDLRELLKRGNGLFGSAEQTGSIGVVTLNCARLGYLCRNDRGLFYRRLDILMNLAKVSLEMKRKIVQRYIDSGLFPYTKRYLGTLQNHFSTIGVNGINECIRNFTENKHTIADMYGSNFARELLEHIKERMINFQKETGHLYNLEATPAEGTTYRFAKLDQELYPDIIQAGPPEAPYYTNSSQLPVNYTNDIFSALEHQESLQRQYTGGTVFHIYLGERVSSATACKKLVRSILNKFRIPYLTVTPSFSICPTHGYLVGEHKYCPKCKDKEQICEIWTRVMGYYRPISEFNIGKKGEKSERLPFNSI